MSIADRFWAKVSKTETCWIWSGGTNGLGYGQLSRGSRDEGKVYAHRFSYEMHIGPIPAGLVLDHLCRNPSCVRPSHLEVVTQRENCLRAESPTTANYRRTECVHGHPFAGANLYVRPNGRRVCRTCNNEQRRIKYAQTRRELALI